MSTTEANILPICQRNAVSEQTCLSSCESKRLLQITHHLLREERIGNTLIVLTLREELFRARKMSLDFPSREIRIEANFL